MKNSLTIKEKLIKKAVKKLQRFGFVNVDEKNIATDDVYKLYFEKILREAMDKTDDTGNAIEQLPEQSNTIKQKSYQ